MVTVMVMAMVMAMVMVMVMEKVMGMGMALRAMGIVLGLDGNHTGDHLDLCSLEPSSSNWS